MERPTNPAEARRQLEAALHALIAGDAIAFEARIAAAEREYLATMQPLFVDAPYWEEVL